MSVTALDDLTIHQGYGTINQIESGDPRWFESYWFHVGLPAGDISIAGHLGSYPVANTMDAAAAVSVAGHQFNVRAARTLERDRPDMTVGPLRAEILEPYRRWRFVLEDDADSGLRLIWSSSPTTTRWRWQRRYSTAARGGIRRGTCALCSDWRCWRHVGC